MNRRAKKYITQTPEYGNYPRDIWNIIWSYLKLREVIQCICVCRDWMQQVPQAVIYMDTTQYKSNYLCQPVFANLQSARINFYNEPLMNIWETPGLIDFYKHLTTLNIKLNYKLCLYKIDSFNKLLSNKKYKHIKFSKIYSSILQNCIKWKDIKTEILSISVWYIPNNNIWDFLALAKFNKLNIKIIDDNIDKIYFPCNVLEIICNKFKNKENVRIEIPLKFISDSMHEFITKKIKKFDNIKLIFIN